MTRFLSALALLTPFLALSLVGPATAELPAEPIGETVPLDLAGHERLVWVNDANIPHQAEGRAYLIDPDKGAYLGMLNTGYWFNGLELPRGRTHVIAKETHFARTTRGERTDIVALYNAQTLMPEAEIIIPPKRASVVRMQGLSALSADERFLAIMNFTPAQSISFVDLATKTFAGEVETPGCTNVYPGGARAFHLLCGDGTIQTLTLADDGALSARTRSEQVFDPFDDPITISGVNNGTDWYFVSINGNLHHLAITEKGARQVSRWSLFTEDEREDEWIISGFQHLALHKNSARLYVLVHQGPPESFEDPATHAWVYDVKTQEKLESIELEYQAVSIAVSQDADPLIYTIGAHFPFPNLVVAWIYFTQGLAGLLDQVDLGLDIYQANQGGAYMRSVTGLGHVPFYIQTWDKAQTASGAENGS